MDSIFAGDLVSRRGRAVAWADSLLVDHGLIRLGWSNAAAVIPGRLYRSNHPSPLRLAAQTKNLGLRSVVSLRGPTGNGSDALLREAAVRLGLPVFDAPLDSGRPPSRERLLHLLDTFGHMPEPALIFCKSGADRAGFAASLFVLHAGGSLAAAQGQLSWRFGHLRRSRAGVLDALLARYGAETGGARSFVEWVCRDYDPEAVQRDFRAGRIAGFVNDRLLARE
jgi:hypothetical protein